MNCPSCNYEFNVTFCDKCDADFPAGQEITTKDGVFCSEDCAQEGPWHPSAPLMGK